MIRCGCFFAVELFARDALPVLNDAAGRLVSWFAGYLVASGVGATVAGGIVAGAVTGVILAALLPEASERAEESEEAEIIHTEARR